MLFPGSCNIIKNTYMKKLRPIQMPSNKASKVHFLFYSKTFREYSEQIQISKIYNVFKVHGY